MRVAWDVRLGLEVLVYGFRALASACGWRGAGVVCVFRQAYDWNITISIVWEGKNAGLVGQ